MKTKPVAVYRGKYIQALATKSMSFDTEVFQLTVRNISGRNIYFGVPLSFKAKLNKIGWPLKSGETVTLTDQQYPQLPNFRYCVEDGKRNVLSRQFVKECKTLDILDLNE